MKRGLIIAVLAILLAAVGLYVLRLQTTTTPTTKLVPKSISPKKPIRKPVTKEPTQPEALKQQNTDNNNQEKLNGEYIDYSETVLNQKLSEGKKVVLFFHAAWCPTCKSADRNIRNAQNAIPQDVTLLKVNYDKEKVLKSKYGVAYQHTFVQIARDKSAITKFQGTRTVPAILANLR